MDNEEKIVCDNCGGTDFTKDGGYFFCAECHTQSQDIQERVFEFNDTVPIHQKKVTIKPSASEKNQHRFTSWEIYNYILRGLVEELQELGANGKFKDVVFHLWLKYLTKLDYISENLNVQPKLGIAYRKRDAEIVYKRNFKRKRKNSTLSKMSLGDMDDRLKHSEKRKLRKKMEKAEYDAHSTTVQSETQSVANQTLSGLNSTDDESSIAGYIAFNKRSVKELLRHMTPHHLQLHMKDINNEMTCHKITGKDVSEMFYRGPEVLTRNKLYGVLYLALMLSQQNIQLSDMTRFCREGHLSFLEYDHFFPDTVNDSTIDHTVYSRGLKSFPSFEFMQNFTFKLYQFLEIRPCDFSPSILMLCRRYCAELNLPDQFYNIAGDFINNTRPFSSITNPTCIPNYEGRAMGFIIYIIKLLLGLDDVTEYELSKFAHLVNAKNPENKLFNFSDWFSYIEYRKTVLKNVHFPTWQLIHPDRECPVDLYVKYTHSKKNHYEKEPCDLAMSLTKKILVEVELLQSDEDDNLINFKPSVTPNRSYLEQLKNMDNFKVLDQPLNLNIVADASKQSIEYLIEPRPYLKLINAEKCSIIFSNARSNHKFKRIKQNLGTLIENTYKRWEKKWEDDFDKIKTEQLAFNTLMHKILNKHIQNQEQGPNFDKIKLKPKVLFPPENNKINKIRNSVGRNARGRFCKKTDSAALPPEKIKPVPKSEWHVSSWNPTPLKNEYAPSLLYQVKNDEEKKEKTPVEITPKIKHLNKGDKYKYHYIPRMEYCVNFCDASNMSKEKFKEFEGTLPKNFQWLLKECARSIEQPTKELYEEFVNVEIYMNYIYFKRNPVISEPLSNIKFINKMIKKVQAIW